MAKPRTVDNASLAQRLSLEAEEATYPLQKALRRAARAAFIWPEEASEIVASGRSLTELPSVGPHLEKLLRAWLADSTEKAPVPPIRRGFLTLPAARKILARHPFGNAKVYGDLQMHTIWSDGSATIQAMAEAGAERGYEYIAITDHGKGLKIAGGIDERQLSEQAEEIEQVNARFKGSLQVLRSIELNLNPRGEGDLALEALQSLDIVVGAFHSALRTKEDQTDRYLAALLHPALNILAHPRGRIYNYRVGLGADWRKVFALAAKLDKAVEVDCYPDRQDLDVGLLKLAKEAGVRISLGTDAHHPAQLSFIELGLAAVAKAGISANRVLNFMPKTELLAWAKKVRKL
jgi:histidinol phosphatase-like PHP family hydrolase